MIRNDDNSRRNFLKKSSLGVGAGLLNFSGYTTDTVDHNHANLPFEITVATVDIKDGLKDTTVEQRVGRVLRSMKNVSGLKPDIICLPEGFSNIQVPVPLKTISQELSAHGSTSRKIAAFAKENRCFVSCPVITRKDTKYYSTTLVIDRNGRLAGSYDKMLPTLKEMTPDKDGNMISPGATDQLPVKTDFGLIGLQMGNDVYNPFSWRGMAERGAKIIIYASLFPGGRMLNFHAVSNHCYLISSTLNEGRIVDISGNNLDQTSEFIRYSWSKLNTERTNILTFPNRLPELFNKYGHRLQLKAWGNTDMLTIESRDPAIKVKDVLKEFQLQTYTELIATETQVQNRYRKKS